MNKWKIIGNTGLAFFTSLGGIATFDALTGNSIPPDVLLPISVFIAFIQGMIALFREVTIEATEPVKSGKSSRKSKYRLDYLFIW